MKGFWFFFFIIMDIYDTYSTKFTRQCYVNVQFQSTFILTFDNS